MEMLLRLLTEHVYLILFVSLILEFVALPIPGETMMALAGVMGYHGHANYLLMIIAGSLGTIIGMQLSYEVGRRLGTRAIDKYGVYIGLTKTRMSQATKFFNKYGTIVIFIAYYLPGVRHILGYFSGISKIDARRFHIYSTIGGIVWVFTFITMGYILGPSWNYFFNIFHKYGIILFLVVLLILLVYLTYKKVGKKDFFIELKESKILALIFIIIEAIVIIAGINLAKNNMHLRDNVIYTAISVAVFFALLLYLKVTLKNRTSKKLLVVVDYQKDFVDGVLGFEGAEKLKAVIDNKIQKYLSEKEDVIFTLDTHHNDYLTTREGKHLPVVHCIRGTEGHALYGDLNKYSDYAKKIFEKENFGSVELAKYVEKSDYVEVEFCGLVSNICVLSNIILVQSFNNKVEIFVDLSSTKSFDPVVNESFENYLNALGVNIIK